MHLTRFIRERTDVELERLARPGTKWCRMAAIRWGDVAYTEREGCLLCNAFDCRNNGDYNAAQRRHGHVELFYMRLAKRNGEQETGEMIARLARRVLRKRSLESVDHLLAEIDQCATESSDSNPAGTPATRAESSSTSRWSENPSQEEAHVGKKQTASTETER